LRLELKKGTFGTHDKGFNKGDIIGCGICFQKQEVFFTQNVKCRIYIQISTLASSDDYCT